ncbi:hypothetical protein OH77DRAFT_1417503 [Trametes cingulata]|nr:hypothetical protein OH77DRAFT_1417503 [Trametes cingulata]
MQPAQTSRWRKNIRRRGGAASRLLWQLCFLQAGVQSGLETDCDHVATPWRAPLQRRTETHAWCLVRERTAKSALSRRVEMEDLR